MPVYEDRTLPGRPCRYHPALPRDRARRYPAWQDRCIHPADGPVLRERWPGILGRGDPVNALASFWYASGWLHFGLSYGILTCGGNAIPCVFEGPFEQIPAGQSEKLAEKTGRYARLLDTARSSVRCAPEASTPGHIFAGKVLCIAGVYAGYGALCREGGIPEKALACFSYGHGWLDAGVTAGLFSITANRDIFTV